MKTSSSASKLPVAKSRSKVRAAPDFSKLHNQWKNKLEQGKACTKKPCTVMQGFDLTTSGTRFERPTTRSLSAQKLSRPMRQTKQSEFKPNTRALRSILNNKGIDDDGLAGRATIASFSSMRLSSSRSSLKSAQEENASPDFETMAKIQEETGVQFEADDMALESILSNEGIASDFAKPKGLASLALNQRQTVVGVPCNFKTPLRPAAAAANRTTATSVRRSIYYTRESLQMGRSPVRPALVIPSSRLSYSARRPPQRIPTEQKMTTPPVRVATPNSTKKSAVKWKDLLGPQDKSDDKASRGKAVRDPVVTTLSFDDDTSAATPPGQNLQRLKELEEAERLLEEEIRMMESNAEIVQSGVTEVKVTSNTGLVPGVTPGTLATRNVRCAEMQSMPVMGSDQATARSADIPRRSSSAKKMTRKQVMLAGNAKSSLSVEKMNELSDKRIPLAARSPNIVSPLPRDQYVKLVASPKAKSRHSSPSFMVFKDKPFNSKSQSPFRQQQVYCVAQTEKENYSPYQNGPVVKEEHSPYFSPALRNMKPSDSPGSKKLAKVSLDDLNQSLNMSVLQYAELQDAADTLHLESEVADDHDEDIHAQLELIEQKQKELLQLQLSLQKRITQKTKTPQKPKVRFDKEKRKDGTGSVVKLKKNIPSMSEGVLNITPLACRSGADNTENNARSKTANPPDCMSDGHKEMSHGHWKKRLIKTKDEATPPAVPSQSSDCRSTGVGTPVSRLLARSEVQSTSVTTHLPHSVNTQVVMSTKEAPKYSVESPAVKNNRQTSITTPASRRLFDPHAEVTPILALPQVVRPLPPAPEVDDIPPAPIKTPLVLRAEARSVSSLNNSGLHLSELEVVHEKHKDGVSDGLVDAVSTLVNMHELVLTPERNRRKNWNPESPSTSIVDTRCSKDSDQTTFNVDVLVKDGCFSPIRIRSPVRIKSPIRVTTPTTISVVSPSAVSLVTINPETKTVTQTTWKSPVRKVAGQIGSLSLTGNLDRTSVSASGLPALKLGPLSIDTSFDMRAKPVDPEIVKKVPGLLMTAKTMAEDITPVRQKGPALRMLAAAHRYHEALLDDEASLYACRLRPSPSRSCGIDIRCPDPVTKALSTGDDMHFIPILNESPKRTPEKSEHDRGSAFSVYHH